VGWCDILPVMGETRAHVGTLGIGVLPHARGTGIGTRRGRRARRVSSYGCVSTILLPRRSTNVSVSSMKACVAMQA
jgi:putative acetyltransferase